MYISRNTDRDILQQTERSRRTGCYPLVDYFFQLRWWNRTHKVAYRLAVFESSDGGERRNLLKQHVNIEIDIQRNVQPTLYCCARLISMSVLIVTRSTSCPPVSVGFEVKSSSTGESVLQGPHQLSGKYG